MDNQTASYRSQRSGRGRAGSARSSRWSRSSSRRSGCSRRWACSGASPSTGSTSRCSSASTSSARSGRRSASTATSRTAASRRSAPVKAMLAILGCMTMQGPLTQWVTDHRKHHALSDKPGDPHSPHVGHGDGASGRGARLRARARRLALHEPRHGAGPRVRQGPLRGPARALDRPRSTSLWVALTLGHPVRDRLRDRRHVARRARGDSSGAA